VTDMILLYSEAQHKSVATAHLYAEKYPQWQCPHHRTCISQECLWGTSCLRPNIKNVGRPWSYRSAKVKDYNACYLIWLSHAIQRKLSESTYHSLIYKVSNKCCSRNADGLIIALETTSELDDKPSQQQFSNVWELLEQSNLIRNSKLNACSA
jgi:hypothetical protein